MDKKVLFSVLDQVAAQRPGAIAIEDPKGQLTYGRLTGDANRMANCLVKEGVKKGEGVGVFMNCSIPFVTTILGVNKAGGMYMALDVEYPIKRMEYILNHVKPGVIVTDEVYRDKLLVLLHELAFTSAFVKRVIVVSEEGTLFTALTREGDDFRVTDENRYPDTAVDVVVDGEDSMYLVNTSGSTGNPKMIEGYHKSLSHFVHWEVGEFQLDSSTRGCVLARMSFDLSLREMFAPLLAGGTLCIPEAEIKSQPIKLLQWIGEKRITLIHPIPSIFRLLMKEILHDTDLAKHVQHFQNILFAGEALFGKDLADWRTIGGNKASLANLYGPSETTLAKICNRIHDKVYQTNEIIPLGKPLPNAAILIIDDGLLCNPNAIGEIHVKTPFRSKGYYREPAMTQDKFIQNPLHNEYEDIVYRTGDLGRCLEDGTIVFAGRQDSQVKIRGNRVELSDVERAILNYPNVNQVVVLPVRRSDGDYVLTCYYISNAFVDHGKLHAFLKDYLPEYMFPSYYIHLDEFPLNLNGKIDRKALPQPEDLLYDQLSYEAPNNPLEEKLSQIWADVLNLKKVGVNNSFYELGGHSLSVTRVLFRISKQFSIDVSLRDIFDNPTIKKLAVLLTDRGLSKYKPIVPIERQAYYPLSFVQKDIATLLARGENIPDKITTAFVWLDSLDKDVLRKALDQLVQRHEALRTTFHTVSGEMQQKVNGNIHYAMKYLDESFNSQDHQAIMAQYFEVESRQEFDLENGPLLSVAAIKLCPNKYFVTFTTHLMISDAWSTGVMVGDFLKLYKNIFDGSATSLAPLKVHYKDYVAWLEESVSGERANRYKSYWSNMLAGELALVDLATDYERKANAAWNVKALFATLNTSIHRGLVALGERHDTTVFSVFLTCVNVLLHRYTGRKDLVTGTPVVGRDHADLENVVGNFVNIIPLRTRIDETETFSSVLNRVKDGVLGAYQHQLYPDRFIRDDVRATGADHLQPLFDVLVQCQSLPSFVDQSTDGIRIEAYRSAVKGNYHKVDLTFDLMVNADQASTIEIEYDAQLFSDASADAIKENLVQIIQTVLHNGDVPLSEIQLISSAEEEEEALQFRQAMLSI
ncbi:non-ribosomal peptide synthetase [Chryseolinea lacunae]|uniref:Amino acid adenylation domain-containing protein n=1 Tax=Chryseolinea lacunae TaxID=2801331 RepID=A0ABS1KUG7_9BACT|nr:non-ribosomal peptide synthetase [Chryseolinea lacunae]MBL0743081.1 amino acid adenylation domain-containing protein [Chryseolinea lacunae]